MSKFNPKVEEFENPDHFKVAKDLAWALKLLVALVVVAFGAGVWATSIASDVAKNRDQAAENATTLKEQAENTKDLPLVLESLKRIEASLESSDGRQRDMKSTLDKVEQRVGNLEDKLRNQ